jgi:hypothetical protein
MTGEKVKVSSVFKVSADLQTKSKSTKTLKPRVKNSKECLFHQMVVEGQHHSTLDCHMVRSNPILLEKLSEDSKTNGNTMYVTNEAKRPFEQTQYFSTTTN